MAFDRVSCRGGGSTNRLMIQTPAEVSSLQHHQVFLSFAARPPRNLFTSIAAISVSRTILRSEGAAPVKFIATVPLELFRRSLRPAGFPVVDERGSATIVRLASLFHLRASTKGNLWILPGVCVTESHHRQTDLGPGMPELPVFPGHGQALNWKSRKITHEPWWPIFHHPPAWIFSMTIFRT